MYEASVVFSIIRDFQAAEVAKAAVIEEAAEAGAGAGAPGAGAAFAGAGTNLKDS